MNDTLYQILHLNEKEVVWLKAIMQNPINSEYDEEEIEDREMRKHFFDTLSN